MYALGAVKACVEYAEKTEIRVNAIAKKRRRDTDR